MFVGSSCIPRKASNNALDKASPSFMGAASCPGNARFGVGGHFGRVGGEKSPRFQDVVLRKQK